MAIATKRSKGGKKTTVAAMIDELQGDEDDDDLVAVVGMSSSVIGDGMDSESDEYMSFPPPRSTSGSIVLSMPLPCLKPT